MNHNNILTKSEQHVLRLLAEGKMYKEIAALKGVGIDTVKKHCSNIYRKLNVKNKIGAINLTTSDSQY